MAHLIESMYSAGRVPTWHGLGTMVDEAPDSERALVMAGLNWNVVPKPVMVGGIVVPNYVANVRDSDNSVLGIISEKYKIVQNSEAFSFTDELLRSSDGEIKYETAGSLAGGKRVWMLAKLPEIELVGDRTTPYLVFTNSHDGKGSIKVAITPIRVVCQNTLNLALDKASRSWSAIHTGNLENKLNEAQRTLGMANQYLSNLKEQAELLVNKSITDNEVADYIKFLIDIPDNASDRKKENLKEMRKGLIRRYTQAEDIAKFRGNFWGFLNATSDFATHSAPLRSTPTFQEKLFEKTINGNPLIDRAFELFAA